MAPIHERVICKKLCGKTNANEAAEDIVVSLPCTVTSAYCFSKRSSYPELFDNARLSAQEYNKMLWIYNIEYLNVLNTLQWLIARKEDVPLNSFQEKYEQMLSFTVLDIDQRRLLVPPSEEVWMPKVQTQSHTRIKRTKLLSLLCWHPSLLPSKHLRELCKKFTTASKMYSRFQECE
jgi:hypothetical protein